MMMVQACWIRWIFVTAAAAVALSGPLTAQTGPGPYARIGVMRPKPGVDSAFEAGYRRHLEWHRSNRDPWAWYGWTVILGERVDWFLDATFGRSASSLDSSVAPAADGRDFDASVTPYEDYMANSVYEFLPDVSEGGAIPPGAPLMELATFDLTPGSGPAFERGLVALKGDGSGSRWFRLVVGGPTPRYLRMTPLSSLAAALRSSVNRSQEGLGEQSGVVRLTVEVLLFRPDMSLGVARGN